MFKKFCMNSRLLLSNIVKLCWWCEKWNIQKNFERLGLPDNFKFGIEIEADNVKTKGKNGLYTGKSAEYIESKNWHMATSSEESLVSEGG